MGIVLSVLTIIGKVLLVLLGILLALILLLLLVPFRYEIAGESTSGETHGEARVSWLLHFLSLSILFSKKKGEEKSVAKVFRVCGISLRELRQKKAEHKKAKRRKEKKKKLEKLRDRDPEEFEKLRREAKLRKEERAAERLRLEAEEKAREEEEKRALAEARSRKEKLVIHTRRQLRLFERLLRALVSLIHRAFWTAIDGIRFLSFLPLRITQAIGKIVSKIAGVCDTIAKWKYFIDDPRVRHALSLLWKRGRKILKAVRPRRVEGRVHFGFEDPSVTGELLALLSAFYPLYGGRIVLEPDFSGYVLEGTVFLSGRVCLGQVGWQVLMLLLSSDVRYTYRYVKELRGSKEADLSEENEIDMKEAS